jgi:Cytochrome c7 and related cytochrome c
MAQVFHRSSTSIARFSILGTIVLLLGLAWVGEEVQRSSYVNYMGIAQIQPVPFSHQHHVGGLGLDCRYCHTSVETSSFAGIPPTRTCMNCHAQIWTNAPMLEPVRSSFRTGNSLVWTRVNDLPDFVYFDHSIHVNKGIGCYSCHGAVDRMPLMYAAHTLQMEWCISCHRNPQQQIRPREQVFNMEYQPPANQEALGNKLAQQYHLRSVADITSCSTCHR